MTVGGGGTTEAQLNLNASAFNGSSWSTPTTLGTSLSLVESAAVSCYSASFCVAVDDTGNAYTFNGAAWSAQQPIDSAGFNNDAVSCPSATFCVAVDADGRALTDTSGTWSSPVTLGVGSAASPSLGDAVSCASASFCVAVGPSHLASVWNGASWTAANAVDPAGEMASVSCPAGGSFCMAVDQQGYALTYASGAWSTPVQVDPSGHPLVSVSCASASFCFASDPNRPAVATYSAGTWALPSSPDADPISVSCEPSPSAAFCAGVEGETNRQSNALTYNGSAWSALTHIGGSLLNGVSCASAQFCLALDAAGNALSYNGAGWSAPISLGAVGLLNNEPSCPTPSFCMVHTGSGPGTVSLLTDTDGTWSSPTTLPFTEGGSLQVSCASSLFCMADDGGSTSTFNGSAWTAPASLGQTTNDLAGLSCPSASFCAAAINPGGRVMTFNGVSWGAPVTVANAGDSLTAISCPSAVFCAAATVNGQMSMWNGTVWSTPTQVNPAGGFPTAGIGPVTCASASFCMADGADGVTIWNGTAWSAPSPVSGVGGFISCPTARFCASVNGEDAVFYTDAAAPAVPSTTATPTITGTPAPGQTMSETSAPWSGSPYYYAYQWEDCDSAGNNCTVIPGADGPTYTVTAADDGDTIRVQESAENSGGNSPLVVSDPTAPVSNTMVMPPPTDRTPPTVTGTAQQGQTLGETNGAWAGTGPLTYAYQWDGCDSTGADCVAIAGATSQTYVLQPSDVGDTVRVQETAANAGGPAAMSATSAPTAVVLPLTPADVTAPSISGDTTQGQTLTEVNATWSPAATGRTYQWEDCDNAGSACAAIAGATSQTYVLQASDVERTIRVQETASDAGGVSPPASSAATGVVAAGVMPSAAIKPANTVKPVISGTATVGQRTSASTGAWSGTPPPTYAYQWQACSAACSNLTGQTGSSLTLTAAMLGARIQVVVTASNAAGSAQATSGQAGPVAPQVSAVDASLRGVLTAPGRHSAIAALLKHGLTLTFDAPSSGHLTIAWYEPTTGAHDATRKVERLLLGSASARFTHPGKAKAKLTLNANGRHLLQGKKKVMVTIVATFTPTGAAAQTTTARREV
jgi:hypothetical protein